MPCGGDDGRQLSKCMIFAKVENVPLANSSQRRYCAFMLCVVCSVCETKHWPRRRRLSSLWLIRLDSPMPRADHRLWGAYSRPQRYERERVVRHIIAAQLLRVLRMNETLSARSLCAYLHTKVYYRKYEWGAVAAARAASHSSERVDCIRNGSSSSVRLPDFATHYLYVCMCVCVIATT